MLFSRLPQWEETGDPPPPLATRVEEDEAKRKLDALTGRAEAREGQRAMAAAAASVFAPRRSRDGPNMLLAEAGTGIGKTLA